MQSDRICTDCNQRVLDRCSWCQQIIRPPEPQEVLCKTCMQPLPEESEESSSEEEYEVQKDNTRRAVCFTCKRPWPTCPECKQDYDSEQDASSEYEDDSEQEERSRKRKHRYLARPRERADVYDSETGTENETATEYGSEPEQKQHRRRVPISNDEDGTEAESDDE